MTHEWQNVLLVRVEAVRKDDMNYVSDEAVVITDDRLLGHIWGSLVCPIRKFLVFYALRYPCRTKSSRFLTGLV